MKQLLLRVDDDLHAELTAQARDAGRSVNALAKDILAIGISGDTASRRDRLKLRLVSVGVVGKHAGDRLRDINRQSFEGPAIMLHRRQVTRLR